MKDKHGYTFEQRLQTQQEQLALWQMLLRPEVFESTVAVLAALNSPSADESKAHHVPLGGYLAQVIYAHPRHPQIADAALMGDETMGLIIPPVR